MARPQIADTTVSIALIRGGQRDRAAIMRKGGVWLSTVVLAELYASTRSRNEPEQLDLLAAQATLRQRLLVSDLEAWSTARRLIARRIRLEGALKRP